MISLGVECGLQNLFLLVRSAGWGYLVTGKDGGVGEVHGFGIGGAVLGGRVVCRLYDLLALTRLFLPALWLLDAIRLVRRDHASKIYAFAAHLERRILGISIFLIYRISKDITLTVHGRIVLFIFIGIRFCI